MKNVSCHSRLDRETQQALRWFHAKHNGCSLDSRYSLRRATAYTSESGMTSESGITDRSPGSLTMGMKRPPRKSHPLGCNKNSASILIITLLTMSIVTIFTQQLVKSSFVGAYFNRTMINREHAEMLALGTINLAMAQLTTRMPEKKAGREEKQDPKTVMWRNYLTRVLPH